MLKNTIGGLFSAALVLFLLTVTPVAADSLVGKSAPDFRLQDQNGEWHGLKDYKGKWIALYFYPKDDTPGCTTEACSFRDNIFAFKKIGAEVLGVSLDDVQSHEAFAKKYHLPFALLADTKGKTAAAYGVETRKYGLFNIANRESFIIGPDGVVAKHYPKVDPDTHTAEVLADMTSLIDSTT